MEYSDSIDGRTVKIYPLGAGRLHTPAYVAIQGEGCFVPRRAIELAEAIIALANEIKAEKE